MDTLWPFIVSLFPQTWQHVIGFVPLFVIVGCAVIVACVTPPKAGSKWVGIYSIVNKISLNIGWAVNAYQPSKSAILVPVDKVGALRTEVAAKLDVPRDATKA